MTDVQVLSMLFCFGFENGAAKQQLQKWELKFVTELEPLEGASPGKALEQKKKVHFHYGVTVSLVVWCCFVFAAWFVFGSVFCWFSFSLSPCSGLRTT